VICYVVVWQHVPVWRVYCVPCRAQHTIYTPDDGRRPKHVAAI